jgi:hypothetical protein
MPRLRLVEWARFSLPTVAQLKRKMMYASAALTVTLTVVADSQTIEWLAMRENDTPSRLPKSAQADGADTSKLSVGVSSTERTTSFTGSSSSTYSPA